MGLTLAEHKTDVILISNRKARETVTIKVSDHYIILDYGQVILLAQKGSIKRISIISSIMLYGAPS